MSGRSSKLLRKIALSTGEDIRYLKDLWKKRTPDARGQIRKGLDILIKRGTINVPRS